MRATSPLLRRALGEECLPKGNGHAIDLGCGGGIETALLLKSGWKVLAIDKEPNAIARVETLKAELPSPDPCGAKPTVLRAYAFSRVMEHDPFSA